MPINIQEGKNSLILEVKVLPRASRNQIVGEHEGALKVKLTSPPVDGEANQSLLEFLARQLQISKKNLRILKGESARQKLLEVIGLSKEELLKRLQG